MFKRNKMDIYEAETLRYQKIQNLIRLLTDSSLLRGGGNSASTEAVLGEHPSLSFEVGRRMAIDGERIKIGKKCFQSNEIKKVTVNTEGSMAIYDNNGKKLCGSLSLNAGADNIELFCVWVRQRNIPVEVVSEKRERFFQYVILSITVVAAVLWTIMRV